MKTIKKEFKKLFPDGLEINKNSKIESIYGLNMNEVFIKIKNKNENEYYIIDFFLIEEDKPVTGNKIEYTNKHFDYEIVENIEFDEHTSLIIKNLLEQIEFELDENLEWHNHRNENVYTKGSDWC